MEKRHQQWKVHEKRLLLLALFAELARNAHVSFEGDLQGLRLLNFPGASQAPTAVLKRNTLWPEQEFTLVPLALCSGEQLMAALGGTLPRKIIHVQIEREGVLEFGAYDNFQHIYFGPGVGVPVIESLVASRILSALSD